MACRRCLYKQALPGGKYIKALNYLILLHKLQSGMAKSTFLSQSHYGCCSPGGYFFVDPLKKQGFLPQSQGVVKSRGTVYLSVMLQL
jgi:hypothetical protein